jgi:type II secretion system protein N
VRRIILQVVGYVVYGLMVFAVLLYVMFPYDLLRQRLNEWLSQGALQFSIARLSSTFPPGLRARQVRMQVKHQRIPEPMLHLDTLGVWPEWLALLSGTLHLHFAGTLYSGRVAGDIRSPLAAVATGWEGQVRLAALDMAQHPLLQQNGMVSVRGQLNGEATATVSKEGEPQQGKVTFRLQPAVFTPGEALQVPLQREIACDTLQGDLTIDPPQWQIETLTCQGNDVFIDVRGTLRPQRPFANSVINLRLQLRSAEAFKQEIALLSSLVRQRPDRRGELSFGLRGQLRQPRAIR